MKRSGWVCNRRDCLKTATAVVTGVTAPWWGSVASAADESTLWQAQKATAEAAFAFWERFLAFRKGPANDQPLDAACRSQFMCIIRAVSWVESKHGTAGAQQPTRDPMQCGNPADIWWKQLTAQTSMQDRLIGGPGAGNYYAKELPDAVKGQADFPNEAKLSYLGDAKQGHNDSKFNAKTSYYWGDAYLVHRINTHADLGADRRTYKCGDCSLERMKKGAVAYNGGGDAQYAKKIADALTLIGCS